MQIDAFTGSAQQLINAINKHIDDGKLKTWRMVVNGKEITLYSHSPEQWDEKAMLKPCPLKDRVSFQVNWWQSSDEPSEETKGYIVGRFTEVLMVHFRTYFTRLEITA